METVFTASALLNILASIEELQDKSIAINETMDGNLQLEIDNTSYSLEQENEANTTIDVPEPVVEQIEEINTDEYENLLSNQENDFAIESGVIKEVAKTILLGGMIRLTGNLLR